MPVRIVTDSTADLTAAETAELGVTVVPLNVLFGSESLRDGVDINAEEFFRRLTSSRVLPKTSQPSVGSFAETYRELLDGGAMEILSIHISSKLSGTLNSARTARDSLDDPSRVTLLDSESVSAQLGYAVRAAATVAGAGGGLSEARAAAESVLRRSRLFVVLDTLEYLQRGGRIGRARAWIGGVLNVKPLLMVKGGEIVPLERVRTRGRAMDRMADLVIEHSNADQVALFHSGAGADLDRVRSKIASALPGAQIMPGWLGPVVGVYAGPQALGAVVVDREAAPP
ncbi:MAG: DegV family protein [Chloroflexi bacterium]|nr:DegV family protein [Chloroflexota bacterium]